MENNKGNAYKTNRNDTPTHTAGALRGVEFLERITPEPAEIACTDCGDIYDNDGYMNNGQCSDCQYLEVMESFNA